LTADQRDRIEERLSTRITKDHVLHVTSQRHRSREANRRTAVERFAELLAEALVEEEPRLPTKVSTAQRRRRLQSKRHRSQKKALRTRPEDEE
jgi:ribosome-associated protein